MKLHIFVTTLWGYRFAKQCGFKPMITLHEVSDTCEHGYDVNQPGACRACYCDR